MSSDSAMHLQRWVPRFSLRNLLLALIPLSVLFAVGGHTYRQHRLEAARAYNLRQIGIAVHEYIDHWKCFPPAYLADAAGRPAHSWRVLLLPYLGYEELYKQYDFNEPWDGPNNSRLHS